MTDLTPEKLDELLVYCGNIEQADPRTSTMRALIAAARERDRLEQACNLARAACKDLGEGVAAAIGYTGAPDGDLLVAECGIMRDRAEAAERDVAEERNSRVSAEHFLREEQKRRNQIQESLRQEYAKREKAERDAKVLRRLEAKARRLSTSDLEHGLHAQFTPTTFLHWIAEAREETDAE